MRARCYQTLLKKVLVARHELVGVKSTHYAFSQDPSRAGAVEKIIGGIEYFLGHLKVLATEPRGSSASRCGPSGFAQAGALLVSAETFGLSSS